MFRFSEIFTEEGMGGRILTHKGMGATAQKVPFGKKRGERFWSPKKRVAVFKPAPPRPYSVKIWTKRNLQGILARPEAQEDLKPQMIDIYRN